MSASPIPVPPESLPAGFAAQLRAARAGEIDQRGQVLELCRKYLLAVAARDLPVGLQAKVGASDLVQETLTQAHANFDRFTGESQQELLAWLAKILEYRLLSAQRAYLQTGKRDARREISLDGGDSRVAIPPLVNNTPGPGSRAAQHEERARIAAALERMQPADREVIELRNLELLSFVEIARRTGRTPDAVRKHWARAVERLLDELGV